MLEATFPVIQAADLDSVMHEAKKKTQMMETVLNMTEVYKICSVTPVYFYVKLEDIK